MDNAGPKRGNWQLQCYSPIARQLYWEKGHYGADEALNTNSLTGKKAA